MSSDALPAHLEVAALIRAVEAAGGIATVIAKGDRDRGEILLLTHDRGREMQLWNRLPDPKHGRRFAISPQDGPDDASRFDALIAKRRSWDRDLWVLELDIADAERFIAQAGT